MSRKGKLTAKELTIGLYNIHNKQKDLDSEFKFVFGNIVQYFNEYLKWKGDYEEFDKYIKGKAKEESRKETSKVSDKKV